MSFKADDPPVHPCAKCKKKGKSMKRCAGCGTVWYCNAACQTADWKDHKAVCKLNKKEKKEPEKKEPEKKEEAARGSGSGLGDMGSILAALMPPPPPLRYDEVDLCNACFYGHHDELKKMLFKQRELDVNWAKPDTGCTAALVAAAKGNTQCLLLLAQHGSADLSKANKQGWAPIHIACQQGRYASLEVLLDNRVDANLLTADECGDTPAIMCSSNGHVKLLALLIDRGADPNLANMFGTTAAHKACQ